MTLIECDARKTSYIDLIFVQIDWINLVFCSHGIESTRYILILIDDAIPKTEDEKREKKNANFLIIIELYRVQQHNEWMAQIISHHTNTRSHRGTHTHSLENTFDANMETS